MDNLLDPSTGDYVLNQITSSLHNAVYVRLVTPLGSYWANISLGSRLHELQREKDVSRVSILAKQYAEQALQTLLDDKRASKIEVQTEQPHNGWLLLFINVWDASNREIFFKYPVKVA